MTMMRSHTLQVQGTGSTIQLGELRWLVDQLSGSPETTEVTVRAYAGDVRESGYVTLSVNMTED